MSERRYSDVEVAAIFEQASKIQSSDASQLTSAAGMTLAQLQDIGREVGIEPAVIAQAAQSVGASVPVRSRTFLGLPITVGRTVQLNRQLSDSEWERLVVDLRETFEARGVVWREGGLRSWTNGNLQILVEPTESGDRIRMRTAKGDVRAIVFAGTTMVIASGIAMAATVLSKGVGDPGALFALSTLGTAGIAMLAFATFRLPAWAKLRRQQMEDVAKRISGGFGKV